MGTRTDRINTLRGLLSEFRVFLPQGPKAAVQGARELLAESDNPVPLALCPALEAILADLDARIDTLETQLQTQTKTMLNVQLLLTIPGIGLLNAAALIAAVGDFTNFHNGRHLAAWQGLTPQESSSGQRHHLGRISKCGDLAHVAHPWCQSCPCRSSTTSRTRTKNLKSSPALGHLHC